MSNWFERFRERERDLAEGADADLVRDNRNRDKVAFGLIGFACLLSWLSSAKIQIPSTLRSIVAGLAIVSFLVGFFLALWARQEDAFLSKPDPEEPPRMFKL